MHLTCIHPFYLFGHYERLRGEWNCEVVIHTHFATTILILVLDLFLLLTRVGNNQKLKKVPSHWL